MQTNKKISEKLAALPHSPGVYIMKNSSGSVIYVGKSKSLKNRVSSYFQAENKLNIKTRKLVNNIHDFETIVTDSEAEALILENELIKRHSPKYNIKLKDSKNYPYIKITSDSFPKIEITHTRKNDKGKYFGPYTSATAAKDILSTVKKTFRLPDCDKKFEEGKTIGRPCLNYHIGRCMAPCMGTITESEFKGIFDEIELFLKGDYTKAEESLKNKMLAASEELRFESAAKYRDSINNLQKLSDRQKIKTTPGTEKDIFGFYETDTHAAVAVLLVRDGIVIDKSIIHMNQDEISDDEALSDLVLRYYHNPEAIPKTISLSFELDEQTLISTEQLLRDRSGHAVNVHTPKKGLNKELCKMAVDNALEAIKTKIKQEENDTGVLFRLATILGLEVLPERIESYDISNSADTDMYCGMIVIENAKFKKSDYRSFSIKSVSGVDDYASMREALSRRFLHIKDENDNTSLGICPDLILLDGGATHVSVIKNLANEMQIDVPIFGMVKDKYHKTRTITDGENEISIAKDNSLFNFVYRIQEEVHRFTFSKMDASRRKRMKKLELTNVKGIGNAKAKAIYDHFSSYEQLKNATVEEICKIKGITPETAQNIIDFLKTETET